MRLTLIFSAILLVVLALYAQQTQTSAQTSTPPKTTYSAIPIDAVKAPNPVKISPESLARAKKWWTIDCEMCHGANGDGKGQTAKEMKLNIADFTDPNTLKDRTDGEIFWVIKNGHQDIPPEGARVTTEQNWDLVNYVRALAKKKDADAKAQ